MEDEFQMVDLKDNAEPYESDIDEEDVVNIEPMSDIILLKKELTNTLQSLKNEKKKILCEKKDYQQLKKQLQQQIQHNQQEYLRLTKDMKIKFKEMNRQITEQKDLNNKIKNELKSLNNERLSLNEEKTHLKLERKELQKQIQENKKILNKYNQITYDDILNKYKKLELQFTKDSKSKNDTKNICEVIYLERLDGRHSYNCKACNCHIGLDSNIESRCYQVGQGSFTEKKRGYLFSDATNLVCGDKKTENFTTGSYTISWVTCKKCKQSLGWKYIDAQNQENNAKVGKYCLSRYELTSPQDRNEK